MLYSRHTIYYANIWSVSLFTLYIIMTIFQCQFREEYLRFSTCMSRVCVLGRYHFGRGHTYRTGTANPAWSPDQTWPRRAVTVVANPWRPHASRYGNAHCQTYVWYRVVSNFVYIFLITINIADFSNKFRCLEIILKPGLFWGDLS